MVAMAACDHGGGIFLGGEALCWGCYQQAGSAVHCALAGDRVLPDRFGCQDWKAVDPAAPLRWCFWCQDYQTARWPQAQPAS